MIMLGSIPLLRSENATHIQKNRDPAGSTAIYPEIQEQGLCYKIRRKCYA